VSTSRRTSSCPGSCRLAKSESRSGIVALTNTIWRRGAAAGAPAPAPVPASTLAPAASLSGLPSPSDGPASLRLAARCSRSLCRRSVRDESARIPCGSIARTISSTSGASPPSNSLRAPAPAPRLQPRARRGNRARTHARWAHAHALRGHAQQVGGRAGAYACQPRPARRRARRGARTWRSR
jgi:hypothetical protein